MKFIGFILFGAATLLVYSAVRNLSVTCLVSNAFTGGEGNCSNTSNANDTSLATNSTASNSAVTTAAGANRAVAYAQQWLPNGSIGGSTGVKYLYGGGRGTLQNAIQAGVDCSGFVYQVFQQTYGINVGTDTVSQFNNPNAIAIPSLSQALPGDLIFFGSPSGGVNEHVGIYIGNNQMIDAPHTGAFVRIDSVTGFGETILGIRRIPVPQAQ